MEDGRIVKGVRFANLRDAGDLRAAAYERPAPTRSSLDVSATLEARSARRHGARGARRGACRSPLTVGGGVRTIDDAGALLDAGADKVAINSAAVEDPSRIARIAERFGARCCVLALDAATNERQPRTKSS
ncbi:MAG: HisA/HisF-related TIM barrel protein [Polyangiaceae bacterium]